MNTVAQNNVFVCIQKLKAQDGVIIGYALRNAKGEIWHCKANDLKHFIATNQMTVTNLALTADGRLIDSNRQSGAAQPQPKSALGNNVVILKDRQNRARIIGVIVSVNTPVNIIQTILDNVAITYGNKGDMSSYLAEVNRALPQDCKLHIGYDTAWL